MGREEKIKLNHVCVRCKKDLFIGEGTIIENKPLHFICYRNKIIEEIKERIITWAEKWGYKGVDMKCFEELGDILESTALTGSDSRGKK